MTLTRFLGCSMFIVILCALSCAPQVPDKPPVQPVPDVHATVPEIPKGLQERLDAARRHVRQRDVFVSFGFWTVFHAILGMGPETTYVHDNDNRKIKAIDYICAGGRMPGLEFREKPDGLQVVTMGGDGDYQGHQDQFIAEMAQWGMPAEREFIVAGKKHPFKHFVQHSRNYVSTKGTGKDKQELSWAVLIIAQYYGTDHRWTNRDGEQLSLEDVVQYEISEPIAMTTACGGTHRLFGLSWVYHLHRQAGGKKDGVWAKLVDYVEKYKTMARSNRNADGTFSTKFIIERDQNPDPNERINTTGHVFEWLALALPDDELRSEWMQAAAYKLSELILESRNRGINAGGLYHATHGLEIYRTRLFGPDGPPPMIPPVPKD